LKAVVADAADAADAVTVDVAFREHIKTASSSSSLGQIYHKNHKYSTRLQ